MKQIPLTQGKFTLVDDADYEWLNQRKWYAIKKLHGRTFYAARNSSRKSGKYRIHMHREILGLKFGDKRQADHVNGNGLDNRRCNLRIATSQQNHFNMSPYQNTSSKFKGVCWHKSKKKWCAEIGFNGKMIHLGLFKNEIEAGRAYDRKAIELFGEFARTNAPEELKE